MIKAIMTKYKYKVLFVIFFLVLLLVIDIFMMQLYLILNQHQIKQEFVKYMESRGYHLIIPHSMHLSIYGGASFNDISVLNSEYQNILYINKLTYKFKLPNLLFGNYKIDGLNFDGVVANNIKAIDLFKIFNNPVTLISQIAVTNLSFMSSGKIIGRDGSFKIFKQNKLQRVLFFIKGDNYKIQISGFVDFLHSPTVLDLKFKVNYNKRNIVGTAYTNLIFAQQAIYAHHNLIKVNEIGSDERSVVQLQEIIFSAHDMLINNINAVLQGSNYQLNIDIPKIESKYWWQYMSYDSQFHYYSQTQTHIWQWDANCNSGDFRFSEVSTLSGCKIFNSFKKTGQEAIIHQVSGDISYDRKSEVLLFNLKQDYNHAVTNIQVTVRNIFDRLALTVKIVGSEFNFNFGGLGSYEDNLHHDKKIDFYWLKALDLELHVALKKLYFLNSDFKNFMLDGEIKNQVINLQKSSGQVFGGGFNLKALGKVSDTGININTNGLFELVELSSLMNNLIGKTSIKGKGDFNFNLNYRNLSSYSDIYRELNGIIKLNASSVFLPLPTELIPVDKNIDQLSLQTNFVNGSSLNSLILLKSNNMNTNGACDIDFNHQNLDCKLLIKTKLSNMGASPHRSSDLLIIPANVSGSLLSPSIRIQNMRFK